MDSSSHYSSHNTAHLENPAFNRLDAFNHTSIPSAASKQKLWINRKYELIQGSKMLRLFWGVVQFFNPKSAQKHKICNLKDIKNDLISIENKVSPSYYQALSKYLNLISSVKLSTKKKNELLKGLVEFDKPQESFAIAGKEIEKQLNALKASTSNPKIQEKLTKVQNHVSEKLSQAQLGETITLPQLTALSLYMRQATEDLIELKKEVDRDISTTSPTASHTTADDSRPSTDNSASVDSTLSLTPPPPPPRDGRPPLPNDASSTPPPPPPRDEEPQNQQDIKSVAADNIPAPPPLPSDNKATAKMAAPKVNLAEDLTSAQNSVLPLPALSAPPPPPRDEDIKSVAADNIPAPPPLPSDNKAAKISPPADDLAATQNVVSPPPSAAPPPPPPPSSATPIASRKTPLAPPVPTPPTSTEDKPSLGTNGGFTLDKAIQDDLVNGLQKRRDTLEGNDDPMELEEGYDESDDDLETAQEQDIKSLATEIKEEIQKAEDKIKRENKKGKVKSNKELIEQENKKVSLLSAAKNRLKQLRQKLKRNPSSQEIKEAEKAIKEERENLAQQRASLNPHLQKGAFLSANANARDEMPVSVEQVFQNKIAEKLRKEEQAEAEAIDLAEKEIKKAYQTIALANRDIEEAKKRIEQLGSKNEANSKDIEDAKQIIEERKKTILLAHKKISSSKQTIEQIREKNRGDESDDEGEWD